ncbi:MAG TPA: M56 family metallopeptidase [Pirellulales bacterium]|jgi:cobalt-zinc-cadmium efflux system membrane fusion protein
MNGANLNLLQEVGRTTFALAVAAVVTGALFRFARVSSSTVHRAGWLLVLVVGWSFLRVSIVVPWYQTPPVGETGIASVNDVRPDQIASELVRVPEIPLDAVHPRQEQEPIGGDPFLALPTSEPTLLDKPDGDIDAAQVPNLAIADAAAIDLALEADDALFTLDNDSAAPPAATAESDSMPAAATSVSMPDRADDSGVLRIVQTPSHADTEVPARDAATLSLLVRGALLTWALGIAGLVLAWLVGYARFVRRLPAGQAADDAWLEEWRALLSTAGVRRAIPLRVTADAGPMLCRLPRGFELLVPGSLWRELNARERACILRHELAHYQRGDVWSSLTVHLLALPHWFNPFAWWAVRRFDEAAEWACDRAAAADEPTTAYARTLLRLGEAAGRHASYSPAARGRTLAARIRRVLGRQSHDDSPWKKLLFTIAAVCIAAAALVRVDLTAREPDAEPRDPSQAVRPLPMGLLRLAAESGDTLHLTGEELTARGLRVTVAKPVSATHIVLRGEIALDPDSMVRVQAPFGGSIVEVAQAAAAADKKPRTLRYGVRVKKGQLLVTVRSKELADKKSELFDALSRLRLDEDALKRLKEAASPEKTVHEADRQVREALIAVNTAERALRSWPDGKAEIERVMDAAKQAEDGAQKDPSAEDGWGNIAIVSPIDGAILEKNVNAGTIVGPAVDLFTIADLSEVRILAHVYEEDLPKLRSVPADERRWRINVVREPLPESLVGTFEIGHIIDPTSHTATAQGRLENPAGQLRLGQFVKATIEMPSDRTLVALPSSAVIEDGHAATIFVQVADKATEFKRRKIAIVSRTGNTVLVHSEPNEQERAAGREGVTFGDKLLALAPVGEQVEKPATPNFDRESSRDSPNQDGGSLPRRIIVEATRPVGSVTAAVADDGKAVAYLSVASNLDGVPVGARSAFREMRSTALQLLKSEELLTRALHNPAVSQLPVVREQPDSVRWLQESLHVSYQSDRDRIVIELQGQQPEQLVKVVNAVLDVVMAKMTPQIESATEQAIAAGPLPRQVLRLDEPVANNGEAVAYIQVARLEAEGRDDGASGSTEFATLKKTVVEMLRSKTLLSRVLHRQSIAELPSVQKQPDPVDWLQKSLQLRYPSDQEMLEITLQADDAAQAVKIVKAVLDVFFQEFVEKGLAERAKKEQLLLKLRKERAAALESERKKLQIQERIMEELDRDLKKLELEKQAPNRFRRVERTEAEAALLKATPSAPPGSEETNKTTLRYIGRSFDEWVAVLETDLSEERKAEAISALEAFSRHGYARKAITKIFDAVRDHEAPAEGAAEAIVRIARRAPEVVPVIAAAAESEKDARARAFVDGVLTIIHDQASQVAANDLELLKTRLGVAVVVVNQEQLIQSNLNGKFFKGGLRIVQVTGAPATEAGWKPGDTIVGIDKYAVVNLDAARSAIRDLVGTANKVTVVLLRHDDTLHSVVNLAPATNGTASAQPSAADNSTRDLAQKEQKLRKLFNEKNEQLIRELKDVETLQKALGIVDSSAAAQQNSVLQGQLGATGQSIFALQSQLLELEAEIDQHKLDIELAEDPAGREVRADLEIAPDDRVKKLEALVATADDQLDDASRQGVDEAIIAELKKKRSTLEDRLHARHDELMKRFVDNDGVRIKRLRGTLGLAEKRRERMLNQLAELQKRNEEITNRLSIVNRDTPELESKRSNVRVSQQVVEEINRDLHRIALEKQTIRERQAAEADGDDESKARERRTKRRQTLKKAYQVRKEALISEKKDVEALQRSLGVIDAAAAAQQHQSFQQRLSLVANSIFSHTTQLANLQLDVDRLQLDIELAQDPQAKQARAEEEMHKDEKLKKLEEQLEAADQNIKGAKRQTKDDPAVKRLEKDRAAVEYLVNSRRDELLKKFSDIVQAVKVKELQGKLQVAQKHRDGLALQLETLKKERTELQDKLTVITRDTAELETRRQKIRVLEQVADEINRDLQKIDLENQMSGDAESKDSDDPGVRR